MIEATDYLRPNQVGKIMGWSVNTLACYRSRGEGPPYVKVRNRVLYPSNGLARWIANQSKRRDNKKGPTNKHRALRRTTEVTASLIKSA